MIFELLTKEELLTAASATKRPVAFLVGAPLSLKDGVGVPGVTEVLELIRDEIRSCAAKALPRFEAALNGKTGGDAYQEAMKWLGRNISQDAINDVIKAAVLKARNASAPELTSGDGNHVDWSIPDGTANLGELVARESERFIGPILTTNFDPLISMAVQSFGGQTGRYVLTADGTVSGPTVDGICTVIHLHGFWRDSDTLHTQVQLTNPRPKLTKSLQRLLQGRTLIVAAYGGWDDVFTSALVDLMNDEQAPLDVIWCFWENDADRVKERYGKLLDTVKPAIVMNRFRAFGGIDCHSIFGEILAEVRSTDPAVAAASISSPLAGWELIDSAYLGAIEPLSPEEVVRYFDGAIPTWRHATCADIPSRIDASEISRRLAEVKHAKGGCSLQLIRAAGGEGKTTLLLQAAAAAAKSGDWSVLWRPASRLHLSPEHISTLDPTKDWLIVADDAENLVNDLNEAARLQHEAGHTNVHFLLAARDTDWRYFNGDSKPWGTWLKRHPDITLRELDDHDAAILVGAWQKYGAEGLRALATLPDKDKQVAALLHAVHEPSTTRAEGSFFGGLLAVRFGPDGLTDHVVTILNRLKERQITGSDRTLFDVLAYVAACHAVGIPGVNESVLADLVNVPRDWVQTLIVNPLGEEAAAVRSAGYVMTRHSKVAAAILVAAEQDLGADIAEIWSAIVRQTVKTGQDILFGTWNSLIIHAGPQLQRNLPQQFSERRRKEIAVAAARSAVMYKSTWLGCVVDLGKTYRNANDYAAAVQVFRDNLRIAPSKADFTDVIRGYWYEWGVAEGSLSDDAMHRLASAWLQGLSIADHLNLVPITSERTKLSCAGIGVAFGKLAEPRPDCPFARARRAAAYLGRLTNPDPKTLGYFDYHDHDADRIGTPHPQSIDEAVDWLTDAVAQANRELQDPFLKGLLKPEQVSFNMLRQFLKPTPAPIHARILASPAPKPEESVKLLQLQGDLEERVKVGIERVLTQAWKTVPADIAEEERFKIAHRNASQEISRLSPSIKRQVGAYFETQKWEPLKTRIPRD
ncbi:MAG: hypothetical protein FD174_4155 [Geobacteraceae bacterium]|nr:MAG: hypothetical protein FD174_4155 [Geobacteraceae bacterium]